MSAAPSPCTLQQVLDWARDPASVGLHSALAAQPFLLLDADATALDADERERASAWLRQLACPVIGICAASTQSVVSAACDVRLDTAEDAVPLITNIRRTPLAAMVLVQLLRSTERATIEDALFAESLAYATLQGGSEFRQWLTTQNIPPLPLREGAGGRGETAQMSVDARFARAPLPLTPSRKGRGNSFLDVGPAVVIERDGNILHLELNRASNRNAMSVEMRDALCEALQLALGDDSIERIEMRGRGKCFSTGGDLSEFGSFPDTATAHAVRSLALPGRLLARCAARTRVRVHGACIGSGIEFPAFAGHVSAHADTWFQLPELSFGLIPGAGGGVSIARRIGRQRTAWLVLSGKRINADVAREWGLVDAVES